MIPLQRVLNRWSRNSEFKFNVRQNRKELTYEVEITKHNVLFDYVSIANSTTEDMFINVLKNIRFETWKRSQEGESMEDVVRCVNEEPKMETQTPVPAKETIKEAIAHEAKPIQPQQTPIVPPPTKMTYEEAKFGRLEGYQVSEDLKMLKAKVVVKQKKGFVETEQTMTFPDGINMHAVEALLSENEKAKRFTLLKALVEAALTPITKVESEPITFASPVTKTQEAPAQTQPPAKEDIVEKKDGFLRTVHNNSTGWVYKKALVPTGHFFRDYVWNSKYGIKNTYHRVKGWASKGWDFCTKTRTRTEISCGVSAAACYGIAVITPLTWVWSLPFIAVPYAARLVVYGAPKIIKKVKDLNTKAVKAVASIVAPAPEVCNSFGC